MDKNSFGKIEMDESYKSIKQIIDDNPYVNIEDLGDDVTNGFVEAFESILGNESLWKDDFKNSISDVINALAVAASNTINLSFDVIKKSYDTVHTSLKNELDNYQKHIIAYNDSVDELNMLVSMSKTSIDDTNVQ